MAGHHQNRGERPSARSGQRYGRGDGRRHEKSIGEVWVVVWTGRAWEATCHTHEIIYAVGDILAGSSACILGVCDSTLHCPRGSRSFIGIFTIIIDILHPPRWRRPFTNRPAHERADTQAPSPRLHGFYVDFIRPRFIDPDALALRNLFSFPVSPHPQLATIGCHQWRFGPVSAHISPCCNFVGSQGPDEGSVLA